MRLFTIIIATTLIVTLPCSGLAPALTAETFEVETIDVTRKELKQRFASRFRDLERLKSRGMVGETHDGMVAAVDEVFLKEKSVEQLITAENRDRELLYPILADDLKKKLTPEKRDLLTPDVVARRNAKRNFENADDKEFLMVADGIWIQKVGYERHLELDELKRNKTVGETHRGTVEAIDGRPTLRVERLLREENEWREEFYKETAQRRRVPVNRIIKDVVEARITAAEKGEIIQRKGNNWEAVD